MADPQQSGYPHHDTMDLDHLLKTAATSEPAPLQCCCGRPDCSVLKHNCSVLDSVEKDVYTAASMGKVRDSQ